MRTASIRPYSRPMEQVMTWVEGRGPGVVAPHFEEMVAKGWQLVAVQETFFGNYYMLMFWRAA